MRYTFKNGIEAEIDFKNKRISGVYRGGENLICGNVRTGIAAFTKTPILR